MQNRANNGGVKTTGEHGREQGHFVLATMQHSVKPTSRKGFVAPG